MESNLRQVLEIQEDEYMQDFKIHMKTVEKVIQGLKRHLDASRVLEKRDQSFQKILKERNFFRANAISLSEENKRLEKNLAKLQTKMRNLEIDNNNYRTFLFKNKESEPRKDFKPQVNTLELLSKITQDNLRVKSFVNSDLRDASRENVHELGYRETQTIIKTTFNRTKREGENVFKANWSLFKKKETFVDSINKAKMRASRPLSNYKCPDLGIGNIKEMGPCPQSPKLKQKERLKSCLQIRTADTKMGQLKGRLASKFKGEKFRVGPDKTLSFLLETNND